MATASAVLGSLMRLVFVFALAGCTPAPERVLSPDPTRSTALGSEGPYGVELIARSVRVRVDEVLDVDVLVPLTADERMRADAPVVLLVQGGLVSRTRYRWLGIHLASRGFVVLAPGHLLDLAFFEQGNALDVLASLRSASRREGDSLHGVLAEGPVAIVGHSLGGVVAASAWGQSPGLVTHLVLLASYPSEGSFAPRTEGRALSLLGTEDGRTSFASASQGAAVLESSGLPVTFALIDGMSHMQFVDDVTDAEAANDGVPSIDTATARARALVLIDALMSDFESGDPMLLDEPARWPEGVRPGAIP